ncbi:MAG: MOSC domain-containing protein [Planctomycetota bacterium]
MAAVEKIWIKRFQKGPMDERDTADLTVGRGIVDCADQGGRHVTIIATGRWQELESQLGTELDPSIRRANLLVSDIDLAESTHRELTIGGCRLRVKGETRPCSAMEAAHPGLQEAMRANWGGGAHAEILEGGTIRIGDAVTWLDG